MKRLFNPLVAAILRSPVRGVLDRRLLLISVRGRQTGEIHTFPVAYRAAGDTVAIRVGRPESKRWWRNLTGQGAPVRVLLRGRWLEGHGSASTGPDGIRVRVGQLSIAAPQ